MSPRIRVLILSTVLAFPAASGARPIRANTPGTGVFIGTGTLLQAVCESREADAADLSGCQIVADFRYTPATHWVFGIRAPLLVNRTLRLGDRELSRSGLGDVELSAKWRFYRGVGAWFDRHAAVEVGTSLPTGTSEVPGGSGIPEPLARRLAPGRGSTDWFLDLVFQQGQRRFVWGGDVVYRRNGEGEGSYDFGDEARLALDFEYVLLPREYRRPGKEVFVLLEALLARRFDDETAGRKLPTGATELRLAPAVQHIATERMLFSVSVELPVWSDVDRLGMKTDWNVLAEVRYAF